MQHAFIIPNKGALVRDPITKAMLPETGATVTLLGGEGRYWRRRIRSGSVVVGKPPVIRKRTVKIKEEKK